MPRLLVVDDDRSMRNLLRVRLEDAFEIIDTPDPEEALALALQHKPDAILLDLMMPKYSGFEVCQTLSSLSFTQRIPIFIVSGESSARYMQFCENLGARGFFQKPVDFEKLRKKLGEAIEESRGAKRAEPRVRLRIMLGLRGVDEFGKSFDVHAVTENVGASGFLCRCQAKVNEGGSVEVYLRRGEQRSIAKARIVRVDCSGTPEQACDFEFIEKSADWLLFQ
jgi:CheY-like chemotaxis protein